MWLKNKATRSSPITSSQGLSDQQTRAEYRGSRRRATLASARRLLAIAAVVFVVAELASLVLYAFGTTTHEEGNTVETQWYPLIFRPHIREVYDERGDMVTRLRYFTNGNVHYAGTFENNLRQGLWNENYRDGTPRFSGNYRRGKLVGLERWWYPNGQLESEVSHKDGWRDGVDKWWYPSGQLRRVGTYKMGDVSGAFTSYAADGRELIVRGRP